jgi:crotonobetainyl-CoA:carnitine CoA-transferase CaiB-like acyl-CoA transferase
VAQDRSQRWAASGLQDLTTPCGAAPVEPPPHLIDRLDALTTRLRSASALIGEAVEHDGLALLAARATTGDRRPSVRESVTGRSRLVPCADGWVAVTLARPDDLQLVPALVGRDVPVDTADVHVDVAWDAVAAWCAEMSVAAVVERATLLGLAIAGVGETQDDRRDADGLVVTSRDPSDQTSRASLDGVRVVDLSALWAGPLCGALLAEAGADVVKVESSTRPDASRLGSPQLFEALNARKRMVTVDVSTPQGVADLRDLITGADVVIEASRPRALRHLGIAVPGDGPRLWLSITAHGYCEPAGCRIGFGDDAAAAGGLVTWRDGEPMFCGDAIADPLTGLTAATVALELLAHGGTHHVDVAMAAVAHRFAT